jgi:methylmalonyl-CoA mutase, C-terminal domain
MESQNNRKIRVIIGKVGLDGHDRGAKIIASALRDAGIEVIYLGLRQTPESMVESAIQEDVDAIGVSILSGAQMTIFPKIKKLMNEKGLQDIILFGGGIIPEKDIEELYKLGIGKLFTPGASSNEIVEYIKNSVK